ncbi:MAG TPA: hypothetical protein VN181_09375 [Thermoanaerobaculia bacterium]|nr:hypothetical protein [Thermoanaerobaculia bacterium]
MTAYTDFAFRPNLTSPEGQVPSSPPVCTSPDIIPAGNTATANFQSVFSTSQSWASDPGQNVTQGQVNYIYVRSKNFGGANNSGQVYLYYAPCAVINWPFQWISNQIPIPSDTSNPLYASSIQAATNGAIAVASQPFQWTPSALPAGSDHYCLFSQVTTAATPNPIPGSTSMTAEDMATIVAGDLGIGWRNVAMVTGNPPTWNYQTMLTLPANAQATQIQVLMQCTQMPTGGAIAFTCSSADGTSAPIVLPQTSISNPNQVSGVNVTLQPGFSGSITASYWANGTSAPAGSGISLHAETPQTTPTMAALVSRARAAYIRKNFVPASKSADISAGTLTADNLPIEEIVSLGAMHYRY